METLFISDLHLGHARPDKLELFRQLLRGPAREARALYILGDLFDQFWLGNDDNTDANLDILAELRDFSRSGAALYFIRGNRELVLDQHFATLSGCTLLPDQAVVDIAGEKILLMHGDLLCTDDKKYQAFRRFAENSLIKKLFVALPLKVRVLLTRRLGQIMYQSKLQKPDVIMDVNQATVLSSMLASHVRELIHGHTHRPGVYQFELNGQAARRIVLGDWYENCEILVCTDQHRELMPIQQYLALHATG
jgi:UDP-2,3-diacylglucosamine hydrolase